MKNCDNCGYGEKDGPRCFAKMQGMSCEWQKHSAWIPIDIDLILDKGEFYNGNSATDKGEK